ncbi:trigger factor [Tumebacillus flagellatus]|uniref:Trigger factor n=1 Tax=Tumebacillus flagellatus TaxID=1157490 RepID=A0A074LKT0_9BACL|nr:trigger factor [Tumebacillus flagellatus]KEO81150.1 trigger factor [Tumebacillus flagellatus]
MAVAVKNWEKVEKNVGVLEFEVGADEVNQALDQAFKKVVKTVAMPGFRKGKVPRNIFENRYGVEVLYQDALDILLPIAYSQAVREANIIPVDRPEIDVVQFGKGETAVIKATVTVKPEVELGEYKGLEVEKKDFAVTAEAVEAELSNLQKSHAEIVVAGDDATVENGDIVFMDFKGFVNGEAFEGGEADNYQLEIGSGLFIPGFEEQLVGMKKGEEKDINVNFPEEYHVKALAGQPAVFKIKLNDVKRKQLPTLDDEFAKDISEFNTLDELKGDISNKLQEKSEQDAKNYIEEAVISKAVENATIDIPQAMIENEIEVLMNDFKQRLQMQGIPFDAYVQFTGASEESLKDEFRGQAESRVRTGLVLEAITDAEGIQASDDEVQAELAKIAESAKMEVERVKSILESRDPELSNLKNDIKTRKTVELLVASAK